MAKRPYYYKAQLLDAISFIESGRPHKALRVLLTTLDVVEGRQPPQEPDDPQYMTLRVRRAAP